MPNRQRTNPSPDKIGWSPTIEVSSNGNFLYRTTTTPARFIPRSDTREVFIEHPRGGVTAGITHTRDEYEFFSPGWTSKFVDYRKVGNEMMAIAGSERTVTGEGAWEYAWLGNPIYVNHQPLTGDMLRLVRLANVDQMMRSAYARFLNQNVVMNAVNAIEADQTLRMLPEFVRNSSRVLRRVIAVLRPGLRTEDKGLRALGATFEKVAQAHGIVSSASAWTSNRGFKTMRESLTRSERMARRALSHKQRTLRTRVQEMLREGGLCLAGSHLAYQFGVAPLVGDTKAMLASLNRSLNTSEMRRGVAQANTVVDWDLERLHVLYSIKSASYIAQNAWGDPLRAGAYWSVPQGPFPVVAKAVVSGAIRFPAKGKVARLIRDYVANGPASLAWELTPFSFVVDWLVDTRVVLGELDALLQGATIEVTNHTLSYKYSVALNASYENVSWGPSSGTLVSEQGLTGWRYAFKYYERYDEPLPSGIAVNIRVGKRQALLSASLLLQRLL